MLNLLDILVLLVVGFFMITSLIVMPYVVYTTVRKNSEDDFKAGLYSIATFITFFYVIFL